MIRNEAVEYLNRLDPNPRIGRDLCTWTVAEKVTVFLWCFPGVVAFKIADTRGGVKEEIIGDPFEMLERLAEIVPEVEGKLAEPI